MDFKQQQDAIKTYIETNLKNTLQTRGLADFDRYIDDFVDLDKYTAKKQLFFNFGTYDFTNLSNESDSEDFEFSVYLVFRKDSTTNLRNNMLDYCSAFWEMFDNSGNNLGGIADYGAIMTVDFYPAAEGNLDVKVAELTIQLHTER